MTYPYDLGSHGWKVETGSATAQTWFDRGLMWTYAYNHDEAIACFEAALDADPTCAMAHWGIGYCLGPNYNFEWDLFTPKRRTKALARGRDALAAGRAAARAPKEAALIEALAARFDIEADDDDYARCNDTYADAMRKVAAEHPDDLDIKALFAEAMMLRTPWQLWDIHAGEPAQGASTAEAIATLETAFEAGAAARSHPGLLHMYVHLMEMSPHPERALWAGDALARLAPDAGHLIHMGSHLDILCGDYARVVERNLASHRVNDRFARTTRASGDFIMYRLHDLHFLIFGALFLGQESAALRAAGEMQKILTPEVIAKFADQFESVSAIDIHVGIRFGRWEALAARELPEDAALYCVTTALTRYGRGLAKAALGDVAGAREELAAFHAAVAAVPETRREFNNTAQDILAIAGAMLEGEVAYRAGDFDTAFDHLRRAVALDDGLAYAEPWGWKQPARHALGALLLEQGRIAEAEAVYRQDLGLDPALPRACRHPDNMWSLKGLHDCLRARGADGEAALIAERLKVAAARSEVPVHHSCLCAGRAAA